MGPGPPAPGVPGAASLVVAIGVLLDVVAALPVWRGTIPIGGATRKDGVEVPCRLDGIQQLPASIASPSCTDLFVVPRAGRRTWGSGAVQARRARRRATTAGRPGRRPRRRRRWWTTRPTPAASVLRRRPWPPARATARGTPTSTTSPSGRRHPSGRGPGGPARPRPRRPPRTRGAGPVGRGHRGPRRRRPRWPPTRMASVLASWHGCDSTASRPGSVSASAAAPNPMMPGMFSSPPRRARSCSPPTDARVDAQAAPHHQSADTGGPPSLWALTETRSAPSSSRSMSDVPDGHARVDMDARVVAPATSTTSRTGCTVPTSWLAALTVHEGGGRAVASQSPRGRRRRRPGRCVRDRRRPRARPAPARAEASRTDECSTSASTIGRARSGPGRPPGGGVHRLGAARGEDDLSRAVAEQRRDLSRAPLPPRRTPCDPRCGPDPGRRCRASPTPTSASWPPPPRGAAARWRRGRGSGAPGLRPAPRRRRRRGRATTAPPGWARARPSPHSPARSPRTMPRSTAQITGCCGGGLAEGAVLGHHGRGRLRGPRRARRTRGR